jgi:hypothetical protein
MTKRQLIERIRDMNPTAEELFLDQFDAQDLEQYLDRLEGARDNRPRVGGPCCIGGEATLRPALAFAVMQ